MYVNDFFLTKLDKNTIVTFFMQNIEYKRKYKIQLYIK